jgi:hypothetical protein
LQPEFRFIFAPYKRILSSGYNWNVGPSNEFKHAQSVCDFGLEPLISGHHGDPQDLGLWRLNQQHDGLLVRTGGAGSVLVNDDFALCLTPG